MGIGGPDAILRVNALDVWTKQFDGVHRVGFAVHDEIGEVEVNSLVVHFRISNRPDKGDGVSWPVS